MLPSSRCPRKAICLPLTSSVLHSLHPAGSDCIYGLNQTCKIKRTLTPTLGSRLTSARPSLLAGAPNQNQYHRAQCNKRCSSLFCFVFFFCNFNDRSLNALLFLLSRSLSLSAQSIVRLVQRFDGGNAGVRDAHPPARARRAGVLSVAGRAGRRRPHNRVQRGQRPARHHPGAPSLSGPGAGAPSASPAAPSPSVPAAVFRGLPPSAGRWPGHGSLTR